MLSFYKINTFKKRPSQSAVQFENHQIYPLKWSIIIHKCQLLFIDLLIVFFNWWRKTNQDWNYVNRKKVRLAVDLNMILEWWYLHVSGLLGKVNKGNQIPSDQCNILPSWINSIPKTTANNNKRETTAL